MSRRRQVAGVREPAVGRAEPAAEKPDRAAGIEGTRRVASFVVEVVLDEEGAVRRTSVLHVADNEEESWAAWEPQGVVDFMAHRMGPGTAKTFVGDPASPVDSLLLADVEASSFGPPSWWRGAPSRCRQRSTLMGSSRRNPSSTWRSFTRRGSGVASGRGWACSGVDLSARGRDSECLPWLLQRASTGSRWM